MRIGNHIIRKNGSTIFGMGRLDRATRLRSLNKFGLRATDVLEEFNRSRDEGVKSTTDLPDSAISHGRACGHSTHKSRCHEPFEPGDA